MKKQKEYKVYENARVEELNSYMYAQIPGKGCVLRRPVATSAFTSGHLALAVAGC